MTGKYHYVAIFSLLSGLPAAVSYSKRELLTLSVSKWCSQFLRNSVFTDNRWRTCPMSLNNDEINLPLNQELRVAVFQGTVEFRHDCWALSAGDNILVQESYGSFIIKTLQDILKFKLIAIAPSNCSRHSSEDLVGLIASGAADLSICHLTVTSSRIDLVDFLHSTLTASRALIFAPNRLSSNEDVFVLTFSGTLWVCFLLAIILLIVCFRFSTWLHSLVRPDHEPWSWIEVILWAIAAVCQQSYSRHPKGLSCRTTFMIGYLITYLLYTGFAAGVTSLLAVQGKGLKLNLDDVTAMKLTLVATTHTTHPHIRGLGVVPDKLKYAHAQKRIKTEIVKDSDELFERLDEENVVGFGSIITLKNHLWRRVPRVRQREFTISTLLHTETQEALIVQKNSTYKEYFNYWLLRMQEHGLLTLGQFRYLVVPQESGYDGPGWSSAGLGNVLSAILILTIGYFASVLILFCEMAWMSKNTRSEWETRTKQEVTQQYHRYHKFHCSAEQVAE